jgi:hypothetical protein
LHCIHGRIEDKFDKAEIRREADRETSVVLYLEATDGPIELSDEVGFEEMHAGKLRVILFASDACAIHRVSRVDHMYGLRRAKYVLFF